MPEKLDRCVSKVKAEGKSEDSAYAICNSTIKEQVANAMGSMIKGLEEHDNPMDIPFGYELHETVCKPCTQDKFMKQQVLRSIVDSRSS